MRYVMATVEKMKEVLADSEKSKRATQLVATRDLESFKRLHAQGDERKKKNRKANVSHYTRAIFFYSRKENARRIWRRSSD